MMLSCQNVVYFNYRNNAIDYLDNGMYIDKREIYVK